MQNYAHYFKSKKMTSLTMFLTSLTYNYLFTTNKVKQHQLTKVTNYHRSIVIQKYLSPMSLNKIVKETKLSKGTVYNIINDWKKNISKMHLEDIRSFAEEVRKSGITIEQCAQGLRIMQLLKEFSIRDDFDKDFVEISNYYEDEDENEINTSSVNTEPNNFDKGHKIESTIDYVNSATKIKIDKNDSALDKDNNYSITESNEIIYFLNTIYRNCKIKGIKPTAIVKWIDDLFLCFFSIDKTPSSPASPALLQTEKDTNFQSNSIDSEIYGISEQDKSAKEEIPLISRVSHYIQQKRKEVKILEKTKQSLSHRIKELTKQKDDVAADLNKMIERKKFAMSYFKWYKNLRQELFYKYRLIIEQEYGMFTDAINDFKQYNFDATKILSEYKYIESLRKETERVQTQVNQNISRRDKLLSEISSIEEQSNYYQQTINIYRELFKEGLGLKELKQLNMLIMESALVNNFDVKESIRKFFKDVEDQYDSKLGFESKINELKEEMEKIKEQVPEYKYRLWLEGVVGPTLIHLGSNGVSNEDIIGMNKLVIDFKNSDFLFDPLATKENDLESANINNKINKSQYWANFIEKLKDLKNINLEIANQFTKLNNLKTQINDLKNKGQKIENAYLESVSRLNYIILQTSNLFQMASQFNQHINQKILMVTPQFSPIVINIVGTKDGLDGDNNDFDGDKEKKDN